MKFQLEGVHNIKSVCGRVTYRVTQFGVGSQVLPHPLDTLNQKKVTFVPQIEEESERGASTDLSKSGTITVFTLRFSAVYTSRLFHSN